MVVYLRYMMLFFVTAWSKRRTFKCQEAVIAALQTIIQQGGGMLRCLAPKKFVSVTPSCSIEQGFRILECLYSEAQ